MGITIRTRNKPALDAIPRFSGFVLLVFVLYFYLNLYSNALTDDAFITLRYVKTLLSSGTWGFTPGTITNAVTSPFNIFLLALAGIVWGPTVNSVIWLTAIILALTVVLLSHLSSLLFETKTFGVLASGALIFNPLLISTLGLESILFIGLYVLSAYFFTTHRWLPLAATLGLITLTRFDGVAYFLVILFLVPTFKMQIRYTTTFLLCIAPWYLFSWIYFGSLLPDTLFIKIAQRSWGTWDFTNGLRLYYGTDTLETLLSIAFLPLLFFLFNRQIRNSPAISFFVLTSITHFIGYSALHVPPYYWYYTPEVTAIVIVGSLTLGILYQRSHLGKRHPTAIKAVAVVFFLLQGTGMFAILAQDGFPIKEMPIHTNWATHEQYKEMGAWLKENHPSDPILVDGEIGTLGYYCDCELLSFFSDRRWLQQYAARQTTGRGIGAWIYKVNFFFLDMDIKYSEPAYILTQIPGGQVGDNTGIMEWETATHWISSCLMRLSSDSE